ncbi:MAG: dihydropteroate synthase [Candidatus Magasanikbacteria bacterium]|nr:dihydropteroate synthase [Candidatus Magasanikbacteria bacterium]
MGSKSFGRCIESGDFDGAVEIARQQIDHGAEILDVCVANPERDEAADMVHFLGVLREKGIGVPVMLDSADSAVLSAALAFLGTASGSYLNAANLEDGSERDHFAGFVKLARKYGCTLVVGCIDEEGLALNTERILSIVRRVWGLLPGLRYHVLFDPLVFPAVDPLRNPTRVPSPDTVLAAVRMIKEQFPGSRTILGISNVSYGMDEGVRAVANAVFFHHCSQAGLDFAVVDTKGFMPYEVIPAQQREEMERHLFPRN